MQKIDPTLFKTEIENHYISVQKHPTEDLFIYNYTQKAQYDKNWNALTLMARGLILDGEGNIKARPFQKFFNHGETGAPTVFGDFRVYEKYDGSLGILYWVGNEPFLATRGSFTSEQAVKGTEMLKLALKGNFGALERDKTYCFEIIYPQNRIVVDYGAFEGLILLAVIDNETGWDYPLGEYELKELPFQFAKTYSGIYELGQIKEFLKEDNKEGFVIFWGGFRLKIKFDEYVRLHRLLTKVTARSIWDLMQKGEEINEMLERVPDEFYDWVKKTKEDLEKHYNEIAKEALEILGTVCGLTTRKERAEIILKYKYPAVVFAMMDGKENKPWQQIIWKILYPPHIKPFKQEI